MIRTLKSLFQRPKPWQKEIQELHKTLVPLRGEAETLQGELVRYIQNLADECYRNGWMNWDEGDEESIEILKRYLIDTKSFSAGIRTSLQSKLDKIKHTGEESAGDGDLAYEEIKFVAEQVVLWCRKNPKLIRKDPDKTWRISCRKSRDLGRLRV